MSYMEYLGLFDKTLFDKKTPEIHSEVMVKFHSCLGLAFQMLGKSFQRYGGFLNWWYPTTIGFPTKNDHFGVFWGYHHLRKHPYSPQMVVFHGDESHTIHLKQIKVIDQSLVEW